MFHFYGFLIGVGIFAGIWVSQWQAKRFGIDPKLIDQALLWIAIPAILGARIYHVLTDWSLYADTPLIETVKVWHGGLGFFGALVGGIMGLLIFVFYFSKKEISNKKDRTSYLITPISSFFVLLDLLSFGAPLAQAIGRFGNYFNHELYGVPTTLPWAVVIDGAGYHPLFAYESIATLVLFVFLNWLGWKKKLIVGKGQYACVYIACYGIIRFWLEFLRLETARASSWFGIFSIAQWVALGCTLLGITLFWLRRHADRGIEWELRTLL